MLEHKGKRTIPTFGFAVVGYKAILFFKDN